MFPKLGTVNLCSHTWERAIRPVMYVVGASLLNRFWSDHPQCEAELRAFHALLSDTSGADLSGLFDQAGTFDGSSMTVELARTRLRLKANEAAQVVCICDVAMKEME